MPQGLLQIIGRSLTFIPKEPGIIEPRPASQWKSGVWVGIINQAICIIQHLRSIQIVILELQK